MGLTSSERRALTGSGNYKICSRCGHLAGYCFSAIKNRFNEFYLCSKCHNVENVERKEKDKEKVRK